MACISKKITAGFTFDCDDAPVGGLDGSRAVLINYDDVDWTASTVANGAVTALVMKTGTNGYLIEWHKELASVASAFVPSDDSVDGFSHSFIGRISHASEASALFSAELGQGKFLVIAETNWKDQRTSVENPEAFKVYGFDVGMGLSEWVQASNENAGSILFTLATKEGTAERFPWAIYQVTDYATTVTTVFTTLLAPAI